MSGRPTFLDWLEYLPRGFRKARCEITGGHQNIVCGFGSAGLRAQHVSLYCERCKRQTRWYDVPTMSTLDEASEDAEAERQAIADAGLDPGEDAPWIGEP